MDTQTRTSNRWPTSSLPLFVIEGLARQAFQRTTQSRTFNSGLTFRGAALEIQSTSAREFVIAGPAETGKTFGCLELLDRLARQHPGLQAAILRKVHRDLFGTVIKDYRKLFERDGVTVYGGEKPEWFDYPGGSRIWVGGLDRPAAFLSGSLDAVYCNQTEEMDLADWETLGTRTTGRAGVLSPGVLFGDCNPGPPYHWIKQRPELRLYESRHEDNPRLYDEQGNITEAGKHTLAVLDGLTGVRKERLRYGRWVQAEGAVYDYDARVHLVDPFPIPADWRRIRSIDFGYTNPFVCQWWAIDPDDRMILYREIYMTGRTVKVHAAQINALSEGETYEANVADHDAEDRATLEENGIYTIPADKEISPGIQAVQERMKLAGDGKPRLMLMRGALVERDETLAEARRPVGTEQEEEAYTYPKAQDGKVIKETPVKLNDHGMDAKRYAVRYFETSGGWWHL